ncbi:MAG TPA: hypothetical protein VMU51_25855 [Mycobacteriales bacterium]|nr:hypothetical protein [Mycobacteriales bacterium]
MLERRLGGGVVRYVVPEALALPPTATVPPMLATAGTGYLNDPMRGVTTPGGLTLRGFPVPPSWQELLGPERPITHEDLLVPGALGSPLLATATEQALTAVGVPVEAARDVVAQLTEPQQLNAHLMRSPNGELPFVVYDRGKLADTGVLVVLAANTFGGQDLGPPVDLKRVDIIEANNVVKGETGSGTSWEFGGKIEFGMRIKKTADGDWRFFLPLAAGGSRRDTSRTETLVENTVKGRWLVSDLRRYTPHGKDVVWTVTAVRWRRAATVEFGARTAARQVLVVGGLQVLRWVPPAATPPPANVPARIPSAGLSTMTTTERVTGRPSTLIPEPVVEQARQLLGGHAGPLLTKRWTVRGGTAGTRGPITRTALPHGLDVFLQLGSIQGQLAKLQGSGMLISASVSRPGFHLSYELELWATDGDTFHYQHTRDQHSTGLYVWAGQERSTSTNRGGGSNTETGGTLQQVPDSDPRLGREQGGFGISESVSFGRRNESTRINIERDTYQQEDITHVYTGQFTVHMRLRRVVQPSTVVNYLFAGIPRALLTRFSRGDDPRAGRPARVQLSRSALVPQQQLPPLRRTGGAVVVDDTRLPRPGLRQVPRDATPASLGLTVLPLTRTDIDTRKVLFIGIASGTVRRLYLTVRDAMLARGGRIAQLAHTGTSTLAALQAGLSEGNLTLEIRDIISPNGYTSPLLVRDDVFADLHGQLTISGVVGNARSVGFSAPSAIYWEHFHYQRTGTGRSTGQTGGGSVNGGVLGKIMDSSINTGIPSASVSWQDEYSSSAGERVLDGHFRGKRAPYMNVVVSALLTVGYQTGYRRGPLRGSTTRDADQFRLDDFYRIAVDLETAARLRIHDPDGYPLPGGGRYLPANLPTERARVDALRAAWTLPVIPGWTTIAFHYDDGTDRVWFGDQRLTRDEFLALLGRLDTGPGGIILAAGRTAAVQASGREPLLEFLQRNLNRPILGSYGDLRLDLPGTAITARISVDPQLRMLPASVRPAGWILASTRTGGGQQITPYGDDLIEIITRDLPAALRPALTGIETRPPRGYNYWRGGPVDQVLVPGQLAATGGYLGAGLVALPPRDGVLVLHPQTGRRTRLQEWAATITPMPGYTTVVVHAYEAYGPPRFELARAFEELAAHLEPTRRGIVLLVQSAGLVLPAFGAAALAADLADFTGLTFIAPTGSFLDFADGSQLLTLDPDPAAEWRMFQRGRAPRSIGALLPMPPWQAALQPVIGTIAPSAGIVLHRTRAGLALRGGAGRPRLRVLDELNVLPPTQWLTLTVDHTGSTPVPAGDVDAALGVLGGLPGPVPLALDLRQPVAGWQVDGGQREADRRNLPVFQLNGVFHTTPGGARRLAIPDALGRLTWQPWAEVLLHSPRTAGGDRPPPRLVRWRPPLPGLREVAPAIYELGGGWVLEVTWSGLWLRPRAVTPADAAAVRSRPPDPHAATIVVGAAGAEPSMAALNAAHALFAAGTGALAGEPMVLELRLPPRLWRPDVGERLADRFGLPVIIGAGAWFAPSGLEPFYAPPGPDGQVHWRPWAQELLIFPATAGGIRPAPAVQTWYPPLPALPSRGGGNYDLGGGWHLEVVRGGVWLRPAAAVGDSARLLPIEPGYARITVGTPDRGSRIPDQALARMDQLLSTLTGTPALVDLRDVHPADWAPGLGRDLASHWNVPVTTEGGVRVPGAGHLAVPAAGGGYSWRPFATVITQLPTSAHRPSVPQIDEWVTPYQPLPDLGGGRYDLGSGWVVEVTWAGLWVRPAAVTADDTLRVLNYPQDAERARITIGTPSLPRPVPPEVWVAVQTMLTGLPAETRGRLRLETHDLSDTARADTTELIANHGAVLDGPLRYAAVYPLLPDLLPWSYVDSAVRWLTPRRGAVLDGWEIAGLATVLAAGDGLPGLHAELLAQNPGTGAAAPAGDRRWSELYQLGLGLLGPHPGLVFRGSALDPTQARALFPVGAVGVPPGAVIGPTTPRLEPGQRVAFVATGPSARALGGPHGPGPDAAGFPLDTRFRVTAHHTVPDPANPAGPPVTVIELIEDTAAPALEPVADEAEDPLARLQRLLAEQQEQPTPPPGAGGELTHDAGGELTDDAGGELTDEGGGELADEGADELFALLTGAAPAPAPGGPRTGHSRELTEALGDNAAVARQLGIADEYIGHAGLTPRTGESNQDLREQVATVAAAVNGVGDMPAIADGQQDDPGVRQRFQAGFNRLRPYRGPGYRSETLSQQTLQRWVDQGSFVVNHLQEAYRTADAATAAGPGNASVLVVFEASTARRTDGLVDRRGGQPTPPGQRRTAPGAEIMFPAGTRYHVTEVVRHPTEQYTDADGVTRNRITELHVSDVEPPAAQATVPPEPPLPDPPPGSPGGPPPGPPPGPTGGPSGGAAGGPPSGHPPPGASAGDPDDPAAPGRSDSAPPADRIATILSGPPPRPQWSTGPQVRPRQQDSPAPPPPRSTATRPKSSWLTKGPLREHVPARRTVQEQRQPPPEPYVSGEIRQPPRVRADSDPLYRGTTRGPEDVFATGFRARNPAALSLWDHVRYGSDGPTGYVSTTRDLSFAANWVGVRYVYLIATRGGYDVQATSDRHGLHYYLVEQQEIAFAGGIPGTDIAGAWPVGPSGRPRDNDLGVFIPNPGFAGDLTPLRGLGQGQPWAPGRTLPAAPPPPPDRPDSTNVATILTGGTLPGPPPPTEEGQ